MELFQLKTLHIPGGPLPSQKTVLTDYLNESFITLIFAM